MFVLPLTPEELDFIITFDYKYRLGQNEGEPEDDAEEEADAVGAEGNWASRRMRV
jgi:hypothetical protein